jgi:processive 1,2-diacylglycerol beta-glucosyltransferase
MASLPDTRCDVLIFSASYGAGHYQVSNALATAIKQQRPDWNVEICDFLNYINPFFKQTLLFGYHQVIKHFSTGYKWFYEATRHLPPDSKWRRMLNQIGSQKMLEDIYNRSPSVIVCTFPTPAGVISYLKSRGYINTPLVTVITDVAFHSQWIHPYVDAYILAADVVAKYLKRKGIPPSHLYVTGLPLRQEFMAPCHDPSIWERYGLRRDLFTLLMMGGGCGLLSDMEDICESLAKLDLPMQAIAVTGTNYALAKRLEDISQHSKIPLRVLGYVDNIAELMEISDLLLTKAGGVTIFEALAKKLPMLIYKPLPGHERSNARFLVRYKVAMQVDDKEEVIKTIIDCVNDPSILKSMAQAMEPISKPFAARDAANIIVQMAENYRNGSQQPNLFIS